MTILQILSILNFLLLIAPFAAAFPAISNKSFERKSVEAVMANSSKQTFPTNDVPTVAVKGRSSKPMEKLTDDLGTFLAVAGKKKQNATSTKRELPEEVVIDGKVYAANGCWMDEEEDAFVVKSVVECPDSVMRSRSVGIPAKATLYNRKQSDFFKKNEIDDKLSKTKAAYDTCEKQLDDLFAKLQKKAKNVPATTPSSGNFLANLFGK